MSSLTQITMVSLDQLVPADHPYRKFVQIFDYSVTDRQLRSLERPDRYKGYGIPRLFRCLLLQFMEDLSDRELMRYLQENTAGKWFCGFDLTEATPDYSVFSRLRKKIGTQRLSEIFAEFRRQLQDSGHMSEVFSFVDASHLVSKANLWEERDRAIAQKYEELNNTSLPKVAHDKQARLGCKGKNKYWYGYKKHVSVDMQSGLINKVAVTPANVHDSHGLKHVCPKTGAVYADKAYCGSEAQRSAMRKGIHLASIKKNNMRDKNKDLDAYYSRLRFPYERVFSKSSHKARYVGVAKNQFAEFFNAICFNLKRMIVLQAPEYST